MKTIPSNLSDLQLIKNRIVSSVFTCGRGISIIYKESTLISRGYFCYAVTNIYFSA